MNTSTQKLFLVTKNDFRANEHRMVKKCKDVDYEYISTQKLFLVAKNNFRANEHKKMVIKCKDVDHEYFNTKIILGH